MVGERIKAIRKSKGLTQRDAAIKANVSQSLWSDIENGKVEAPHVSTLARMAGALEVPVAALLDAKDASAANLAWFWRSRFALLKPSDLLGLKKSMQDRIVWSLRYYASSRGSDTGLTFLEIPPAVK